MLNSFNFILFFLSCFFGISLAFGNDLITVKSEKISYKKFYNTYYTVGKCKFLNSYDYYSRFEGNIDYILNTPKDVLEGDILFAIDSKVVESEKMMAEVALYAADNSFNRDKVLFEKRLISKEIFDKSKEAFYRAKFNFDKSTLDYNNKIIKAKFNGHVGSIKYNLNDFVSKGSYLFSLVQDGEKLIFVDVSDMLYKKIKDSAQIFFYDIDQVEQKAVSFTVSDYLSNKGVISVKILTKDSSNLIHNSFVNVKMIYNVHDALSVPERSVLRDEDGHFIYKISNEQTIEKVYMKIGTVTEGRFEVLQNDHLKEGDLVVREGMSKVLEGSLVQILE